jgi:hypothetical protein
MRRLVGAITGETSTTGRDSVCCKERALKEMLGSSKKQEASSAVLLLLLT